MKDSKKIRYNLLIGVFGQVVAMVFGAVVPRFILTGYGSEVNGLLSSVVNIYAYIAIVEAGIFAASRQALYRTLTDANCARSNSVLSACNRYYHRTGFIYLGLIAAFSILYPILIHTEIPYTTVVLIILFNGVGNVISYFFHGKYVVLLKSDGKSYVCTGIESVVNILRQVGKIVLISLGFDVVFVQAAAMLASFVQMFCITLYIRKNYTWIDLKAEPDHAAISQTRHVFVHEINYLISGNVDTVMLTAFSTLLQVSVYSLYNMLFGVITRALWIIKDAFEFKIAHVFHQDKKAFLKLFEAYETCYITLAFALFTIANYFMLPFMRLYTSGVTDANYLDAALPYAFVFVNLLAAGRYPCDVMIHISGHFRQTKTSALVETLLNIGFSAILVHRFGIFGVLLGTVISSLYRGNYLLLYINRNVIGRSPMKSYKCWLINFAVYLAIVYVSRWIRPSLDTYLKIFTFCVPYALGVLAVYFGVTFLTSPNVFGYLLAYVKNAIRARRGISHQT